MLRAEVSPALAPRDVVPRVAPAVEIARASPRYGEVKAGRRVDPVGDAFKTAITRANTIES